MILLCYSCEPSLGNMLSYNGFSNYDTHIAFVLVSQLSKRNSSSVTVYSLLDSMLRVAFISCYSSISDLQVIMCKNEIATSKDVKC